MTKITWWLEMAWWPEMAVLSVQKKKAGPVQIFSHASIVIVWSYRSKMCNRMDISYANIQ